MFQSLKNALQRRNASADPLSSQVLSLEGEVQSLRLELVERQRQVESLKRDLERLQRSAGTQAGAVAQSQVERLMIDLAGPLTQLATQAHLLEVEAKPVQARDVLAVANRLRRSLEEAGLSLDPPIGEVQPFDPGRHEPLSVEARPQPGQPVTVRFAAVTYQGRLLRKAGVIPSTFPTPGGQE